jgi:hypothetical protein
LDFSRQIHMLMCLLNHRKMDVNAYTGSKYCEPDPNKAHSSNDWQRRNDRPAKNTHVRSHSVSYSATMLPSCRQEQGTLSWNIEMPCARDVVNIWPPPRTAWTHTKQCDRLCLSTLRNLLVSSVITRSGPSLEISPQMFNDRVNTARRFGV